MKSLSCISSVTEGCEAEPPLLWHWGMSGGTGCPRVSVLGHVVSGLLEIRDVHVGIPNRSMQLSHVIQSIGQGTAGRKCDFFPSEQEVF